MPRRGQRCESATTARGTPSRKRHRGEPGHTRDTRDTRAHAGTRITRTNLTTIHSNVPVGKTISLFTIIFEGPSPPLGDRLRADRKSSIMTLDGTVCRGSAAHLARPQPNGNAGLSGYIVGLRPGRPWGRRGARARGSRHEGGRFAERLCICDGQCGSTAPFERPGDLAAFIILRASTERPTPRTRTARSRSRTSTSHYLFILTRIHSHSNGHSKLRSCMVHYM